MSDHKGYRAPTNPLSGITLSRRLRVQLLCAPDAPTPMAAAVKLRGALMDLGYHVLLMSPTRMMIATPERPKRFEEYHLDQAERLLERCHE